MKQIKLIYVLLLTVALPLLIACTNDDLNNSDPTNQKGEKVTVRFRVSQAGTNTMRAVGDWEDKVAEDDEMMNIWTVIAVNVTVNNKVAGIWSCKPTGKEQEVDGIEEIFDAVLDKTSRYRFYSFANMGAAYLKDKLGFTSDIIPVPVKENEIARNTDNLGDITLTEERVNAAVVSINGNGFDPTEPDNDFGAKGIPMSNVQEFNDLQDGSLKDLIVVRMLAKIELWLYNGKGGESDDENPIQVNSITLTDITENANDNLKLLPKYKVGSSDWADKMDPGKLEPNTTTTGIVDLTISSGANDKPMVSEDGETSGNHWTVKAVENKYEDGTNDNPIKIMFYVNESATPANDFKHFFLEMEIEDDKYVGNKKARYVMIDDKNKDNGSGMWNYIARNDYRIIPIVLDDYKLDMIPYDFPAIGVHPASVKEEDGIYTATFHDYGHFHLVPQVTKYSDGKVVPYTDQKGTQTTYWTLVEAGDDDFSKEGNKSWGSWIDATKATTYDNAIGGFYREEYVTSPNIDADDAGGVPVWYENDGSDDGPQWSPDGKNYPPFIFGYIADPGTGITSGDCKVYHEFTIRLHKNGDTTAERLMIYRLYMILDEDQMLYRNNGAAPVRHTHGH